MSRFNCSRFVFITLLLVIRATIGFAQDTTTRRPEGQGRLQIAYHIGSTKYWVDTTVLGQFENEEIQVSHSLRNIDGGQTLFLAFTTKKNIVVDVFQTIIPENLEGVKAVFCNGFQSWTTSREYSLNEKIPRISAVGKAFAGYYGDYDFFKYPAKKGMLHGWAYTYLRQQSGQIVFIGSVSEYSGYTLFLHDVAKGILTVQKDCAGLEIKANSNFDGIRLFMLTGDDATVFDKYASRFADALGKVSARQGLKLTDSKAKPALGWTSWYNYYNKISPDIILSNLRNFKTKKVPISMFQVDDGYQLSTGDWLHTNARFAGGMKIIADSIHAAGYKAGIWLAPFICERKSFICEQHQDWLLKDAKGKAIVVGINPLWSGNYYALDIYNKDVRTYLKTVFDTVLRNWDYDMVKLDFLFAAALYPPKDKTRGQVMTDGMIMLRELVGDNKFIDGCGAAIGPAFKLTDYCRISSDIHTHWEQRLLKAMKAHERLSVWNSLTTVIGRYQIAGCMLLSDPDVFILRKENQHLNKEQQHTMLLVDNLFGKLVLMSDNISKYDSTQMREYLSSFPYRNKEHLKVSTDKDFYRATFDIQGRPYLALINLSGKPKQVTLDTATYFNGNDNSVLSKGSTLTVKPYQSICLYRLTDKPFEVLGGNNNLFPGTEVENIDLKDNRTLDIKFRDGYAHTGAIVIKVPTEFKQMQVNGKALTAMELGGIHCLLYRP